ncbi:mitochondrial acyl carrier protein [Elasticomyces elasticus]|uniref:Acyl carrier protein n=1 Tax=Exophiala sideris TaxID=1016849 RepID=A0ABR0JG24_9EURO|nr:mitochondrial acyl carrier protein [Elasticomyces elasticus]KAK5025602.1 mitochondrial acyl carrier protein [Exophiala sideris]KAK5063673.1 mitochondrial acyl carrier protein [Exophiala sideris]KAK5176387.1 mitochondrial acyl carrier protein [Eurotiomycetes sp. CCFEE 6388]
MIRAGVARALYAVTRTQVPRQLPAFRNQISSSLLQSSRIAPSFAVTSIRCYSAPAGLSKDEVQGRIMDLLKNFDKVTDASKISGTSHFQNDLGLDSLDTVEVVMAIEEEFSIEIPDKEADAIHSVDQAVTYISNQPDAH